MLSTLDRLNVGDTGIVKSIDGRYDIKRRLLDIGLAVDLPVECILVSPMGDPKAYWIRGALIALRYEDANNILIERVVC